MFFNFALDAAKSIFSFLFSSCNSSIVSCRLSIETVGEGILLYAASKKPINSIRE